MHPYIYIFGKQIPTYGLCFYLGIVVAVSVAMLLSKRRKIQTYDTVYAAVIASLCALAGAKILFILINLRLVIEDEIPFINLFFGGFVFYGGLIGGIIGLYIYVKGYKLDIGDFFDLFATVVPLGHAFGRVGCFLGGCCYGIEYDGPLHCTYSVSLASTPIGVPLFPVQLLESLLLLCLFALLVVLYFRNYSKGTQVAVYGIGYSIIRFCLEFLRGDKERGGILGVSTSQVLSIVLAICIIVFLIIRYRKTKKVS